MITESQTLNEMYALLQECGEDKDCGCGCSGERELDEKPEKSSKKKRIKESTADKIIELLAEAKRRRKIGLRRFKNIAKFMSPRKAQAPKLHAAPKASQAVRAGAAYNRHRR